MGQALCAREVGRWLEYVVHVGEGRQPPAVGCYDYWDWNASRLLGAVREAQRCKGILWRWEI